jgi:hypothetical protein
MSEQDFVCLFFEITSCCVVQADLKLEIFLPHPPEWATIPSMTFFFKKKRKAVLPHLQNEDKTTLFS